MPAVDRDELEVRRVHDRGHLVGPAHAGENTCMHQTSGMTPSGRTVVRATRHQTLAPAGIPTAGPARCAEWMMASVGVADGP